MRLKKFVPLAAVAVTLSGCIDVDMTANITGADTVRVEGYTQIEQQTLRMMGVGNEFCNADEGGTLTNTETHARCDVSREGRFDEVFQGGPNEPTPTATDLGDGTVRVAIPLGAMTQGTQEMRSDPQAVAMMTPMFDGHTFTIRVAGAEIISSNGTIADDGLSASYTFPLVEILNPDFEVPEVFETVVRY